jgi:hypothetical protein
MEQFARFMELNFSVTFAIVFIVSLFWGASWLSKKTGQSFGKSIGCVWWSMVCTLGLLISIFNAFFETFK